MKWLILNRLINEVHKTWIFLCIIDIRKKNSINTIENGKKLKQARWDSNSGGRDARWGTLPSALGYLTIPMNIKHTLILEIVGGSMGPLNLHVGPLL